MPPSYFNIEFPCLARRLERSTGGRAGHMGRCKEKRDNRLRGGEAMCYILRHSTDFKDCYSMWAMP